MERKPLGSLYSSHVAVTVMRNSEQFGARQEELQDGNMIPRLCLAVGEKACEKACQLAVEDRENAGVMCAEYNIANALETFGIKPENFILAAATREKREDGSEFDNVFFGDNLEQTRAYVSPEGYTQVPAANAFFFRPGIDTAPNGKPIDALGMRMADCGSVNYEMLDRDGNVVLGQAHFSRINMRGPSAFEHNLDGEAVSWGEYALGSAIEHYGADPQSVRILLSAAVEGKDFLHHYVNGGKMEGHFPGWNELGFMHPEEGKAEDFDCLIDYREMIEWQVMQAANRYGVPGYFIKLDGAINTGDLSLGHASHHWSSPPKNKIASGRDLYIVGINVQEAAINAGRTRELADSYNASAQFEYAEKELADADRLARIVAGRLPIPYTPNY